MATTVKFLRGQSSALSTLTAPSDGVFYLAEDTKKLNVGLQNDDGTTSVYELNKDITVYKNLAVLEEETAVVKPKTSSFFFLEDENIFCIYTKTGFVQINPDTGMTGIEDNRSAEKDEDGYAFYNQPITSVSYDATKRKLIVNSGDKFVTIATFKQLKAIVEANRIIGGVSSEFSITDNDEKILSINAIDQSKITGLSTSLEGKVDKKTSVVTETDENGETVTKEVEWTLVSPVDQAKLASLVIGENGIEVSGKVNASNVEGLTDWISNNREIVDGLFSLKKSQKLDSVETGAQVNTIEQIKLANNPVQIVDKTVNIPIASSLFPGLVMSSSKENQINIDADGFMSVNSLNVNRLVQTEGEMFIINGGDATN